ncbi:hypothetical protein NEPAR04_2167 [Nematocida parisii]|nr:hypothetical protein NEPAR04_2167 [Nematocida parisii]
MARNREEKKESTLAGGSTSEKKESKPERILPYSVKDFIPSKYGAPLLKELEVPFKKKHGALLSQHKDKTALHKYMRALVKVYTSWAQSSPLCGNKRARMYTLLKEIEVATKAQKVPISTAIPQNTVQPTTSNRTASDSQIAAGPDSESIDTLLENTAYNTQSFSMLGTSQTETDTLLNTTQTDNISDLLDISDVSSDDIVVGRRRFKKD